MSIGNFKETSEGSDNNESRMENSEKKGEQKTESTEKRNENVDSKMDEHESKQEKQSEDRENKKDASDDSQKQSPWERMKSFFKKDGGNEKGEKNDGAKEETTEKPDQAKSFRDRMKEGAPSLDEQAATAKNFDRNENKKSETSESSSDEARTPGGDAWERRFGKVERE